MMTEKPEITVTASHWAKCRKCTKLINFIVALKDSELGINFEIDFGFTCKDCYEKEIGAEIQHPEVLRIFPELNNLLSNDNKN
jgi:hypothetical protein